MRDGIEHVLTVGDIVADRTRRIFRIARLYQEHGIAKAELEFTTGGIACRMHLRGLSLATVQQVAASHVCAPMPPPTRDEVAYVNYDRSRYLRRQA